MSTIFAFASLFTIVLLVIVLITVLKLLILGVVLTLSGRSDA